MRLVCRYTSVLNLVKTMRAIELLVFCFFFENFFFNCCCCSRVLLFILLFLAVVCVCRVAQFQLCGIEFSIDQFRYIWHVFLLLVSVCPCTMFCVILVRSNFLAATFQLNGNCLVSYRCIPPPPFTLYDGVYFSCFEAFILHVVVVVVFFILLVIQFVRRFVFR